MKMMNLKFVAPIFAALISMSAMASTTLNYGADSIELLSVVSKNCSSEMAQTLSRADGIGSAAVTREEDGKKTYKINFVRGGFAPEFEMEEAAQLVITKVRLADAFVAIDQPTQWEVKCELTQK
jgi:hypothetical protein